MKDERLTNKYFNPNEAIGEIDLSIFPETVRTFIEQGTEALECDNSYFPTLFLGIAGAAIGAAARVKLKNGWYTRANLFVLIIGESSMLKSPSLDLVSKPIEIIQRENRDKYKKAFAYWNKDENKNDFPKPVYKEAYVSDATMAAMQRSLKNNPHSVLVMRDEMSGYFALFDAFNKNGGGADRKNLLEWYDNKQGHVSRKGEEVPTLIELPVVSLVGGAQESPLKKYFSVSEDGFRERFTFTFPDSTYNFDIPDREMEQVTIDRYNSFIINLYRYCESLVDRDEILTYTIHPEAWSLFKDWVSKFPKIKRLGSMMMKERARTTKFALILEVVNNPSMKKLEVSLESMKGAISLSNFYMKNYVKVLDFIEGDEVKEKLEKALDWLQRKSENSKVLKKVGGETGVPLRLFYSNGVAGVKNKSEALELLEILEDRGHGRIKRESDKPNAMIVFVLDKS